METAYDKFNRIGLLLARETSALEKLESDYIRKKKVVADLMEQHEAAHGEIQSMYKKD